ncbi:MAG: STAS domain-containing protein [Cytophagales bacterium]|nr:STAS domain-containing protein [Cytophagales bacterium]
MTYGSYQTLYRKIGADIISIIGEIDASSSIELDLTIAKSLGEGFKKIIVDCSAMEYISSAGLGVFMSYIEEIEREKHALGNYLE